MKRVVVLAAMAMAACLSIRGGLAGPEDVPESLTPLDYLVGGWKGAGVPQANKLKGWTESHAWAWKFAKGTPVGMVATFENDKLIKQAELTFDATSKSYKLAGTNPDGKPVAYSGTLDKSGKVLTLLKTGGDGERITIRPNSEKIRYTMVVDRKAAGSPAFSKFLEVGVTKDGEAFAAGSATSAAEKCIITGGSASMTVSFEGKTYPICCTGCRDEFNDNPKKYVEKALLRSKSSGGAKKAEGRSKTIGKDDGGFDPPPEDSSSKKKP